jgi:hypothetical protein
VLAEGEEKCMASEQVFREPTPVVAPFQLLQLRQATLAPELLFGGARRHQRQHKSMV